MLTMLHHYVTETTSNSRPDRHTKEEISYVITCAIGSTPLPQMIGNAFGMLCAGKNHEGSRQKVYVFVTYAFDLALLALCTISLVGTSYNAFLYFRF